MSVQKELRAYPFLRILIPFILGILYGDVIQTPLQLVVTFVGVSFICMVLLALVPRLRNNYRWKGFFGVFMMLAVFGMGIGLVFHAKSKMELSIDTDEPLSILAVVEEPSKPKPNSVQTILRIEMFRTGKNWHESDVRLLTYFQKDSCSRILRPGDVLLFTSRLQGIRNRVNPNEFDYALYMRNRHILYSTYLRKESWTKIHVSSWYALSRLSHQWRSNLLAIYSDNGIENDAYGVLAALTLGYRDSVSNETREVWASAGAMHVLAVSGLHVGIIYMVLNLLLRFLLHFRWGKYIRGVVLLLVLWMYALLTGLSPSVMRATTMFTFIVVGQCLNRSGTIYNSLAASAFFLLLIDPFLLFSVGFQLSYLAVLAIVFFQPRIYRLWTPSHWFVDRVWALTSVSLAAQLGTFPLGMYYFHQFPNYFLLTNLIVIPFAALLIYLVLGLFLFSKIPFLAKALAGLIKLSYGLLDGGVRIVKELPGAVWENIQLDGIQMVGIYVILVLGSFLFLMKRPRLLFGILVVLLLIQVPQLSTLFSKHDLKQFTIYNIKGHSVYSFIQRNKFVLIKDSLCNEQVIVRNVEPYAQQLGIQISPPVSWSAIGASESRLGPIDIRQPFCMFGGRLFAFVMEKHWNLLLMDDPIKVDFLVLGGGTSEDPSRILDVFHPKSVVLDPSLSYSYRKVWEKLELSDSLKVFDVSKKGAFVFSPD